MNVTPEHWLNAAKKEPLAGGSSMNIRRFLVIHHTAGGTALSSINFWRSPEAKGASAHLVVDRDGTIFQCRPFSKTCGHAGVSSWTDPRTGVKYNNLNSCSIGIEIANGGDSYPTRFSKLQPITAKHKNGGPVTQWEQYTPEQIATVTEIAKVLVKRYNLDDVVGHEDIAPSRKNDPGPAFPMTAVREACGFKAKLGVRIK